MNLINYWNKKISIFFLIISLVLVGCSAKSVSKVYENAPNGYIKIHEINNLSFYVPQYISNQATAITQITNDKDYDLTSCYVYKDGKDSYVMFAMSEFVVIATKGTTFHFSDSGFSESSLNNCGLLGTWFEKDGKEFTYVSSINNDTVKTISNVKAQVVITTNIYGDFVGKLATIEQNEEEWSLFAGVKAESIKEMSDNQESFINSITSSMYLEEDVAKPEKEYDVVIDTSLEDIQQIDDKNEFFNDESNEDTSYTDDNLNPDTNNDIFIERNVQIESIDSKEEAISIEDIEKNNVIEPLEDNSLGINIINQNVPLREIGKAYPSDEYSLLNIGQSGILSAYDENMDLQNPIIRLDRVITGPEALWIVKENARLNSQYDYFNPPQGYSWNVIAYSVSYQNCTSNPYINITLEGMDGLKLKFKGVGISERTHDCNYAYTTKDGNEYNKMVYFAIPNGCKEYVIRCGEGTPLNTLDSAYYYVSTYSMD